jgi:hypothetical protein
MGTYGTFTGVVRWYDADTQVGYMLSLKDGEVQASMVGDGVSSAAGNILLDENGMIMHDLTNASIITPVFGIGITQDVLRHAEDFDGWDALGTASVTADTHVSPDGYFQNADTINLPAVDDYILKSTISSPSSPLLEPGENGVFSVWLKADTPGTIRLRASRPVVGLTECVADVAVTTQWRRCNLVFTNDTAVSTGINISILRATTDQLSQVVAWGAQVTFGVSHAVPYWPYISDGGLGNGMFVLGQLGLSGKNGEVIIGSDWVILPTGEDAIAIGATAGYDSSGTRLIAIGKLAGREANGTDVIAIGHWTAGYAWSRVILLGPHATATADDQIVFGSDDAEYTDMYGGGGVAQSTPPAFTIHATGGSGTNIAGGDLKLAGGRSTGTGAGGSVVIQTAPAGGSGTSQNALVDRVTIGADGTIDFHNNAIANWAGPGGSTSRWRTWFGA